MERGASKSRLQETHLELPRDELDYVVSLAYVSWETDVLAFNGRGFRKLR